MPRARPQQQQSASQLVELPEPLLLAVLRRLAAADEQRSLLSAARAHSRLRQAAVQFVSSITVGGISQQQVLDGVLLYLDRHGQHLSSVSLGGVELPGSVVSRLRELALTPQLVPEPCVFPTAALQQLQQLTSLQLSSLELGADSGSSALQPLQLLSRLVDLRLRMLPTNWQHIDASMLSSASNLTHLQLVGAFTVEPGALADKAQLQHLQLDYSGRYGTADAAQLLSHLEPLQQLTYLSVRGCMRATDTAAPPAEAYSALTASSNLRHLDISCCTLPAGVWQHVFPADWQLPHLTLLDIAGVEQAGGSFGAGAAAPDGSLLVSCCPGLQQLRMTKLKCTVPLLAPLRGLSPGLHTLRLTASGTPAECLCLGVVWQLTGLRELAVDAFNAPEALLRATQLRQLTSLEWTGRLNGTVKMVRASTKSPGDEPVWRQVLRLYLNHSNPAVAQQAAAALAE